MDSDNSSSNEAFESHARKWEDDEKSDEEKKSGSDGEISNKSEKSGKSSSSSSSSSSSDSEDAKSPASNDRSYPRSPSPAEAKSPRSLISSKHRRSPGSDRYGTSPSEINSPKQGPQSPASDKNPESPSSDRFSPSSVEKHPRSPSPQSPSSGHLNWRSTKYSRSRSPSDGERSPSPAGSPDAKQRSPRSRDKFRENFDDRSVSPSALNRGNRSPRQSKSYASPGGNSNISSSSSYNSSRNAVKAKKEPNDSPQSSPKRSTIAHEKPKIPVNHAEDLSDVSDDDSGSDNISMDAQPSCNQNQVAPKSPSPLDDSESNLKKIEKGVAPSTALEGEEALDFEAEELVEEGECETEKEKEKEKEIETEIEKEEGEETEKENKEEKTGEDDEGECKEDLEEGELTDEGENRPEETEPRPICRFYSRGQCTWGSSCRFVHPGVTDKGNYTMFEMVRPLVPVNGPSAMFSPAEPFRALDRPAAVGQLIRKEEPPVAESAWERGLRQAKEMLRKSTKRKETEVDFEEKKMNLTLGQDELDKENEYYTRTASPPISPRERKDSEPGRHHRAVVVEHFEEYPGVVMHGDGYLPPPHPLAGARGEYWPPGHRVPHHYPPPHHRMHYPAEYPPHRKYPADQVPPYHRYPQTEEYYDRKYPRQKHPQREVIVQRAKDSRDDFSPPSRRERRDSSRGREGGRGDEWVDSWMRSKPPARRKSRSRRASYSSNSSYSSSSSSGSSSRSSSYSRSYSRSRSRSRSSSPVPSRKRGSPRRPPAGGPRGKIISPGVSLSEKRAVAERALHMNPPPPSPHTSGKSRTSPSGEKGGVPPRLLAHSKAAVASAMRSARSASNSSRSSSGSSSPSSSDSSESSLSSSSSRSSRSASPPARGKRSEADVRAAPSATVRNKGVDALKLSGQKEKIKLNLKNSHSNSGSIAGKKRPAESPLDEKSPPSGKSSSGSKAMAKKAAPSRREELLKQLKAVEDAIARKRSKIA